MKPPDMQQPYDNMLSMKTNLRKQDNSLYFTERDSGLKLTNSEYNFII